MRGGNDNMDESGLSEIVDIEILLSVHGGLFFLGHCNCHFNLIIQVLCILNFRQCKKGHLYVDISNLFAHINIKVAFFFCHQFFFT